MLHSRNIKLYCWVDSGVNMRDKYKDHLKPWKPLENVFPVNVTDYMADKINDINTQIHIAQIESREENRNKS